MSTAANPPAYEYDLFVSYSHKDQVKVHKLVQRLKSDQFRIWIDEEQMGGGDPLQQVLVEGINKSAHTLVCLSPSYRESKWAAFEGAIAQQPDPDNSRRRVIPVRVESCELPQHYSHLYAPDLTGEHDWEVEYRKTVKNVRHIAPLSASQSTQAAPDPQQLERLRSPLRRVWHDILTHPVLSNVFSTILVTASVIGLKVAFPGLPGDYLTVATGIIMLLIFLIGKRYPNIHAGSILLVILVAAIVYLFVLEPSNRARPI